MARSMIMEPDSKVYRSVVTIRVPGGTVVKVEGPYVAAKDAKARVTFWKNYYREWSDEDVCTGSRASGHIEEGTVNWAPVT